MQDNKGETFGNWLQAVYHKWSGQELKRKHTISSQADFAKWLGVPTTSLSTWMNDIRTPVGDNVDRLADKLGVEVYDILGLPRRMPKDKKLNFIASVWRKVPEELQNEFYEKFRNAVERDEEDDWDSSPSRVPPTV